MVYIATGAASIWWVGGWVITIIIIVIIVIIIIIIIMFSTFSTLAADCNVTETIRGMYVTACTLLRLHSARFDNTVTSKR